MIDYILWDCVYSWLSISISSSAGGRSFIAFSTLDNTSSAAFQLSSATTGIALIPCILSSNMPIPTNFPGVVMFLEKTGDRAEYVLPWRVGEKYGLTNPFGIGSSERGHKGPGRFAYDFGLPVGVEGLQLASSPATSSDQEEQGCGQERRRASSPTTTRTEAAGSAGFSTHVHQDSAGGPLPA